jgi:tRNA 2-thiouridine synthesizing protein A
MADKIDARGLSCPQPVILTGKKMKEMGKGVLEVLVDTDTSRENVSRLASEKVCQVEVKRMDEDYCLVLRKE